MDVERDAQNDQSSGSEPRVNSRPSGSDNSNDQACQTDPDLYESLSLSPKALARLKSAQEITGFRSYAEYLKFHEKSYPIPEAVLFSPLFSYVPHFQDNSSPGWPGTIVNLTEIGGLIKHDDRPGFTQETQIIEALCDPPKDASLQIILFDTDVARTPTPRQREVFDYLGLVLELDPKFFMSMLSTSRQDSYNPFRYHPGQLTVGQSVATICHSRCQSDNTPNVIIVVREKDHSSDFWKSSANYNSKNIVRICQSPSLRRHRDLEDLPRDDYIRLLSILLAENKKLEDPTTVSLLCLLPLFRLELVKIQDSCWKVSEPPLPQHLESQSVYDKRTELRNSIDRLLKDRQSLETYIKSSQIRWCTKGQIFRDLEADLNEVTANAEHLESSLRDRLQLEVGKLGLEESKKSIDLSNRQIEEAKRVKIFTILAFIYVPLNLATSIFGMNIQQLNESGKSLWVFLLTALVTLAVTGCLWLLIELLNGYQNWKRGRPKLSQNKTTSSYSMGERVAMIVWLLRHHHISWMKKTGAWWRIMANDRARYIKLEAESEGLFMSVCDYVSLYSRPIDENAENSWQIKAAFDERMTWCRMWRKF